MKLVGRLVGALASLALIACGDVVLQDLPSEATMASETGEAETDAFESESESESEPEPDPEPGSGEPVIPSVVLIRAGRHHTCAVLSDGRLRCFGANTDGQLGLGHTLTIGDDETPFSAPSVKLGHPVVDVALGRAHTCALLSNGAVRCWGQGLAGELGSTQTDTIGDDELVDLGSDVEVGFEVSELVAGGDHTCVRSPAGAMRCWGHGTAGELGYGNLEHIGDDEAPVDAGDVPLGWTAAAIAAGEFTSCATNGAGAARCWGYSDYGEVGQPGYSTVGGSNTPASLGDIDVGGPVAAVATGDEHTCARLDDGSVRCWGLGADGRLGTADTTTIGMEQSPSHGAPVALDATVVAIAAGADHTCALTGQQEVWCWGANEAGQLGYGHTDAIGDDETPQSAGPVDVGGVPVALTAGAAHTCVRLESAEVVCWGSNALGQLGYGRQETIGDDEVPAEAGRVWI